jgi:hypothetical protein
MHGFKQWLNESESRILSGIAFLINPTARELFDAIRNSTTHIIKGLVRDDGTIYWALDNKGLEHTQLNRILFGKKLWDSGEMLFDPRVSVTWSSDPERFRFYGLTAKGTPQAALKAINKIKHDVSEINNELQSVVKV